MPETLHIPSPPVKRRLVAPRALVLGGGLAGGLGLGLPRLAAAQADGLTCSGAGVNVKEMPGPDGGAPVPLRESFAFDAHYAQCVIEDNPAAFAMDTHSMGRVVIQPHAFFMAMYATDIDVESIRRVAGVAGAAEAARVAKLVGQLGCATYAGTAAVTVGSRTDQEPAFFEIEAVDGGHGGGAAGDRFAFTVFFDPAQAPLNHAIFGPRPTFTGEMVAGEITIAAPALRPLLE
jgi:hypothetical protein